MKKTVLSLCMFVAVLGAIALPALADSGEAARGTKTVRVGDDFFSPNGLRINRGSSVRWVWSARNDHSHDVSLTRAPAGVRKGRFQSSIESTGYRFQRRFSKAGRYGFICRVHPDEMRMGVRVSR